jgi:hypothetical protein
MGFDPRILQPVASRYTDYAIPARKILLYEFKFSLYRLEVYTTLPEHKYSTDVRVEASLQALRTHYMFYQSSLSLERRVGK